MDQGINTAVTQIQPGSSKENKGKKSASEQNAVREFDTQIDWPESLPASPQAITPTLDRNLGRQIQEIGNVLDKDDTELRKITNQRSATLQKSIKEVKTALSRPREKNSQQNNDANSTRSESKEKKKDKRDASALGEYVTENKRLRMNGESLLASSLEAVAEELRGWRLQRVEETQQEELRRKKDRKQQLRNALPAVYRVTKKLIASYGEKKELIPWALKVLIDEKNAQMFLSLEGE